MRIWTVRPRWHAGVSFAWSAWLVGVESPPMTPGPAGQYTARISISARCAYISAISSPPPRRQEGRGAMSDDPYHAHKPVHMAHRISRAGGVSPLCAAAPRRLNLRRATWTNRREAVTCPRCLERLAAE